MVTDTRSPAGHPLDRLRVVADRALARLPRLAHPRSRSSRGTSPPAAQVLRALALQALYSIPNVRVLRNDLARYARYRRFVGLRGPDSVWSANAFSLARARLFEAGIAPVFFQQFLGTPGIVRLLLDERLHVDDTMLDAWTHQEAPAGETGKRGAALASLLLLPWPADSMRYVPFLDVPGGPIPAAEVIARLRAGVVGRLAVVCGSAIVEERLRPLVAGRNVELLTLEPGSELTRLASAASRLRAAHLAVFDAGAALLPVRVVRRLCEHHLRHHNDFTRLASLPSELGAEIYSTWCLHRMRAEVPRTLNVAPEKWLELELGGEERSPRLEDVRRAPCVCDVPAGLPARVRISEPGDWQFLARALQEESRRKDADEWGLLRAWRNAEWRGPEARVRARPRSGRAGRQPRVLLASPNTAFSGAESMFVRLSAGLLERGCDVRPWVVRPGIMGSLLSPQHRRRLIADGVEFDRPLLGSFDYCLRVLRRIRPSLLHCNGVASWPILAAADVCRVPVVQHVRIAELDGTADELARGDRLVAVSHFVAGELRKAGADGGRILVSYDGIDAAAFRRDAAERASARRRFGLDDGAFLLLCIARVTRSKRIDVVMRAFAGALRLRPDSHLFIAGEIEDAVCYESLQRLAAELELEGRVRFLDVVEHIRPVHAAADALMLASLREPLGVALLEAMAMQTPIIATASGGIVEIVDETCASLVPPDSTDGFGDALRRVAGGDPALLRKARHARAVVQRRFRLEDHVEAISRLYRELA